MWDSALVCLLAFWPPCGKLWWVAHFKAQSFHACARKSSVTPYSLGFHVWSSIIWPLPVHILLFPINYPPPIPILSFAWKTLSKFWLAVPQGRDPVLFMAQIMGSYSLSISTCQWMNVYLLKFYPFFKTPLEWYHF